MLANNTLTGKGASENEEKHMKGQLIIGRGQFKFKITFICVVFVVTMPCNGNYHVF